MKLSFPIYHLKRQARILSRKESITLLEALDRIAAIEGFPSWSLLAAKHSATPPASRLFSRLKPGDLLLLGARPGHGKTSLSLELAVTAMKAGRHSMFFSLEFTESHCVKAFEAIGENMDTYDGRFTFDGSDEICAEYIERKMASAPQGSFVVVDYLQVLDQRRSVPPISEQIASLRLFAKERGFIFVFISQISREYDYSTKPLPDVGDVRLPNPLDLKLFDKACFLNNGELRVVVSP